ncbi:M23 family metallopeptidase [Sedimentibacter sp. zth1]|uniref:M23 family metallopeptidase n=1 Tax=Sedimentibacter sp. zth1 TaxID=2816908 RepID=UPI001A913127|nr:M23 family metallopeptidase [Sedimentibacter sp. zth1]QSX05092.1 M23 family metallopeptidase [Sedimentibacter sp. zth1]
MLYKGNYKISSPYGMRDLYGDTRFHKGVDLVGVDDKTILSPLDGTVMSSTIITDKSNLTWEWGNYIRIDSNDGYRLYFCHLSRRLIEKGCKVKKGDPIGIEGNTGYTFGSHLHFEVRTTLNTAIDPVAYLKTHNIYLGKELTLEEAKIIVKEKVGLEDNTMQYLEFYRYGNDLILKLAKKLI